LYKTDKIAVSSANIAVVVPAVLGISEENKMYKIGPSTLPCRMPALMGCQLDTLNSPSCKYELILNVEPNSKKFEPDTKRSSD